MKLHHYFILILALPSAVFAGDLPNQRMTPGALDSFVTQTNIQETICVKGYTKTIRPPQNYTNKLKKYQIREYDYQDSNPKHYEEDHLVPLNIGGSPNDPLNLWPQPRNSEWNATKKDILEFKLYKLVCHGVVPLNEARNAMATDWIRAYKKYAE
ncbi:MAG: hypothetical protein ACXW11_03500 [Methylotenera sp.]